MAHSSVLTNICTHIAPHGAQEHGFSTIVLMSGWVLVAETAKIRLVCDNVSLTNTPKHEMVVTLAHILPLGNYTASSSVIEPPTV